MTRHFLLWYGLYMFTSTVVIVLMNGGTVDPAKASATLLMVHPLAVLLSLAMSWSKKD